jgi:hypothetical protein
MSLTLCTRDRNIGKSIRWIQLILGLACWSGRSFGAVPDLTRSYYVPQAGPVASPIVGADALRSFRLCPNNDGTQSLPNSARIKVVIKDGHGSGISGIAAGDIVAIFNGGTRAQGFDNVGADSIIANSQWNPGCPDMILPGGGARGLVADAPTDIDGVTYLTFTGAAVANPGVGVRDPNRKWGHYDSLIPVFIEGLALQGRLTETSPPGSFALEIKNLDSVGGLAAVMNQGERINSLDIAPVQADLGHGTYQFWHDFDWDGVVSSADLSFVKAHNNHNCASPQNP